MSTVQNLKAALQEAMKIADLPPLELLIGSSFTLGIMYGSNHHTIISGQIIGLHSSWPEQSIIDLFVSVPTLEIDPSGNPPIGIQGISFRTIEERSKWILYTVPQRYEGKLTSGPAYEISFLDITAKDGTTILKYESTSE